MRPSGPALLLLTLLPGCGLLDPSGCDAYATYMFAVDVTDSRTGQPITSPLTLAVWRRDQILVEEEGRCDHAKTTRVAAALMPL